MKNAVMAVIKVCIICAGLVFLFAVRPEPWQAWVFVSALVAFLAFSVYGNVRKIRDSSNVLEVSEDGLRMTRWGNQIAALRWDDIKAVRPKGIQGGIWIDSINQEPAIAVEHTISDLERIKEQVRQRTQAFEHEDH
jgi:hypothetical protein